MNITLAIPVDDSVAITAYSSFSGRSWYGGGRLGDTGLGSTSLQPWHFGGFSISIKGGHGCWVQEKAWDEY